MIKYVMSIDNQLIPSRRGDWCRVSDLNARLAEQEAYMNEERRVTAYSHVQEMTRMGDKLFMWRSICAALIVVLLAVVML